MITFRSSFFSLIASAIFTASLASAATKEPDALDPILGEYYLEFGQRTIKSDAGLEEIQQHQPLTMIVAAFCEYTWSYTDLEGIEHTEPQSNYIGYVVGQEKVSSVYFEGETYRNELEWVYVNMNFIGAEKTRPRYDISFQADLTDEGLVATVHGDIETAHSDKEVAGGVTITKTKKVLPELTPTQVSDLCGYDSAKGLME
jgi:hypothetical protein